MKAPTSDDNIWIAAGDDQLDRVKELLDDGVGVNSKDEYGYTPLHAAVSYGHKDMIKLLVERGADVNIEDGEGDTPLFGAETVDIAKILVEEYSAYPAHRNYEDITAAITALKDEDRPEGQQVAEFLSSLTHEKLPSLEENEDEAVPMDRLEREGEVNEELSPQLQGEGALNEKGETLLQSIIKSIEDNGGVKDEEELKEKVTELILSQMAQGHQETPTPLIETPSTVNEKHH